MAKKKRYFIKLKSGYVYEFSNYRNIDYLIDLEIQEKPKKHYDGLQIFLKSVEKTNIKELKKLLRDRD